MTTLAIPQNAILFLNNLAGDDLWEYGHLILPGRDQHTVPLELLKYKDNAKNAYNPDGVYVTSISHTVDSVWKVQIYGFPFLPVEIDPFDIEYPISIQGIVITEDLSMYDYFREHEPHYFEITNPQTSRLTWAKAHNLPVVFAVHHSSGHKKDTGELAKLIGMEVFCPVIWCHEEPNVEFFQQAIEAIENKVKNIKE